MERLSIGFFARCRATICGLGLCVASLGVGASPIAMGFLSFDVTTPTTAQLDIANLTGSNGGTADFPILTPLSLSGLSLVITFQGGSTETFGQSDFTLSADGLSYDGPTVALAGIPIMAVLTGNVSPTSIDIGTGTPVTIQPAFLTVTLTGSTEGPLQDFDTALIFVDSTEGGGGGGGSVPEPGTLALLASVLLGFAWVGWRRSGVAPLRALLAAAALFLPFASQAATVVKLSGAALPSSGVAGVSSVKLVTTNLPTVAPGNINVAIAPTCAVGGTVSGEVDTVSNGIGAVIGTTAQVRFAIPASLSKGTYFVSISGTDSSGVAFASNSCSILNVTTSNTALNSCLPTSSLAVALGPTVTAYVPNGWWGGTATGVQVAVIEGPGGLPVSVATRGVVNSCSSNPATGEAVCTANTNDVYRITGTTLTSTLLSGANGNASFSGGSCRNCGVAINALTNTAYLNIGIAGSPSGGGIQALNLNNGTFGPLFPTTKLVSENISVDAGRNLILSPGEDANYDLITLNASGALVAEYNNTTLGGGIDYDSAAEDCTTGIALTSIEFTSNIGLADLNQLTLTPGTPAGTWVAPHSIFTFAGSFAAGTTGISVAPGSSHLGIVTGEFGGQSFAVFSLPSTPGTGGTVPTVVDYAYVTSMPNTPDGVAFSSGFDPHTITAYTSPNDGKAYGLIADWARGTPSFVAVIDLDKIMTAPRNAGTHTVNLAAFNLLTSGAVRYVAVR